MNNIQMNGVNAEALEGLPTPQAIGPQDRTVSIRTATVEIKALTVNGRQVTQALFKQLPELDCIEFERILPIGTWWGLVRYNLKTDESVGWPIIFELDGKLYRDSPSRVLPTDKYPTNYQKALFALEHSLCVYALWQSIGESQYGGDYIKTKSVPEGFGFGWPYFQVVAFGRIWSIRKPSSLNDAFHDFRKPGRLYLQQDSFVSKHGLENDLQMLESRAQAFSQFEALLNDLKARYAKLFDDSQALEQLFIAV